MKILNLYSGIGGNRKLWPQENITSIEYDEEIAENYKRLYPNDEVIITDAHEYLLNHFKEYDFIWSSPPCPSHSIFNFTKTTKPRYPDMKLYEEIIFLKYNFKWLWVVENVKPYYNALISPYFCDRHVFWANFQIPDFIIENRKSLVNLKISELMKLHEIDQLHIKLANKKRQVLRNCVNSKIGLHVYNCMLERLERCQ